jgi:hypothetical protein
MPSASDSVTDRPEQGQNGSDHENDDAERPDDSDLGDKADDEQDDAEDNQVKLL